MKRIFSIVAALLIISSPSIKAQSDAGAIFLLISPGAPLIKSNIYNKTKHGIINVIFKINIQQPIQTFVWLIFLKR